MRVFAWDESFDTHLAGVDEQHHRLVELINELGELMAAPTPPPESVLLELHKQLTAYSDYHFAEEVQLMQDAGVDARHRTLHKSEHDSFRHYVAAVQLRPVSGAEDEKHLLLYLIHWLTYHILGADQSMTRQIQRIRAGATPAQAFEQDTRSDDRALRLLLRSGRILFDVLSTRNHELAELTKSLEARVEERTRALELKNEELRTLVEQVERLAMTDSLTGLPNRRYAMTRLGTSWATALRYGVRVLACLVIDADGFKQVNDTCGHEAGDRVLKALAEALRRTVRASDEVCRMGGDEFLVLCPETPIEGAVLLGERLRVAVASMRVETGGYTWHGSISVGVSAARPAMQSCDDLLRAADGAVLAAKRNGRNCVVQAANA